MGNPIVHFEIGCRDSAKAQAFYGKLFDWKFESYGPTAMITGDPQGGILGHISALGHEPHNYTLVYVQVDDLQAYLTKAESLGGKTMVPPTDVPQMGQFAWLTDPEGTIVGLWKPLKQ